MDSGSFHFRSVDDFPQMRLLSVTRRWVLGYSKRSFQAKIEFRRFAGFPRSMAGQAKRVVANADGLLWASEHLKSGENVAFPTETVYGLGANALDERAVKMIFEKKGRPLTDPLIVHVVDAEQALQFVVADKPATKIIFQKLAEKFWPGPLTMVLRASPGVLPALVGANTGYVGIRSPAHPVARKLLEMSNVPVAAPSANRFGHVSPTSAQHVLDDLGAHGSLVVLDGGDVTAGSCSVGIESTVIRVCDDNEAEQGSMDAERELVLFRRGGVSENAIRAVLDEAGFVNTKIVAPKPKTAQEEEDETIGAAAPGQMITHYAPDVETWLLKKCERVPSEGSQVVVNSEYTMDLADTVIIDFAGSLSDLEERCAAYSDLSQEGDMRAAAQNLFRLLRWAEKRPGAKHVLLQDVSFAEDELAASVADRMFRAASGKVAESFEQR